ncbi:uncharacterized protein LOC116924091 isoform X2 [Daphnia magna]|uniref:uncharacterized protein LOC116924091 isoform X2 n=1 Tax=Daphnia magna TaxID=35525 RepID=UPI001E1BB715|nr:uncharacterized protein LOC116924091 isoform X2 [Daphnia magna]
MPCRRPAWLLMLLLIAEVASDYRDAFEYPFVMPRHPAPAAVRTPSTAEPWRHFYPESYDFSDYSRHITRTDPASRNSAAEQVPSGPYFAQELKRYYHKPADEHKVYQTSWNMIDSQGNEYASVYNRPTLTNYRPVSAPPVPLLSDQHAFVLDAWQRQQQEQQQLYVQQQKERPTRKPISKKPARKKNKVRPIHPAGYQQHVTKRPVKQHENEIDKMADGLAGQSIASAYPNGVMGTLSLMAGLVWYLVNKSATPVIKMRQHSDGFFGNMDDDSFAQTAINQLADYWLGSLKQTDCQQRAICELVSQSSWLSSATRWSQSAYRSAMVQKTIESLKEDDELVLQLDDDQSKMALLVQAALQGEQGVDCAAIYPHCSLPFREESRDRRR